jgi:hypothetical protein
MCANATREMPSRKVFPARHAMRAQLSRRTDTDNAFEWHFKGKFDGIAPAAKAADDACFAFLFVDLPK